MAGMQGMKRNCWPRVTRIHWPLLSRHSLTSIAFPAISTGVFGYPPSEAAAVSSTAVMEFLEGDETLKEVRLIFFQRRDADAFLENHAFK